MTQVTLKEMTANIRKNIKHAGIKARVSMGKNCGMSYIRVSVPTYESRFTAEEIRKICFIAKVNRLTGVRGDEIDIENEVLLTGKQQWDFHFHA